MKLAPLVRGLTEVIHSAPLLILFVYGVPLCIGAAGFAMLLMSYVPVAVQWGGQVLPALFTPADEVRRTAIRAMVAALPTHWLMALVYRVVLRPVQRRVSPAGWERVSVSAPQSDSKAPPLPAGRGSVLTIGNHSFKKIGIVLSGGGAKGVYQAGAMQAIYSFLHEKDALGAVKAIAGTSIGSWNALFWLARLIDRDPAASLHREWWTKHRLRDLVNPRLFLLPGVHTHLITAEPWHEQFDSLFGRDKAPGRAALARCLTDSSAERYYLSRTHVLPGRLAFDTNDDAAVDKSSGRTHDMDMGRRDRTFDEIKEAVFTSMGIPPLFPYTRVGNERGGAWSEDGGVVDNLPIRLATAFQDCDLLFVLPLNATFAIDDLPATLPGRVWRVMDLRQGILERLALKATYLFNIRQALMEPKDGRYPIPTFVIAPGHPLRISTTELWRSARTRSTVFDQMQGAAEVLLAEFFTAKTLGDFFTAFKVFKQDGGPLAREGFIRMRTVSPVWRPGEDLGEEVRF